MKSLGFLSTYECFFMLMAWKCFSLFVVFVIARKFRAIWTGWSTGVEQTHWSWMLISVNQSHFRDFNTHKISIGIDSTRRVRLPHAECDFTRRMWFYTQSVLSTHTRVSLWVWILYARVWFLHAEYNFYTQCDFDRLECDSNAYECDFNTHKIDFFTQRAISTRSEWFYTEFFHSHESIYDTNACIRHSIVWFIHAERNFHTHCDFDTHECDYDTHDCDFNMHT
jgi:hypothetical protein